MTTCRTDTILAAGIAAFGVALLLGVSQSANATAPADTPVDPYVRYHEAIRVTALCEDWKLYSEGPLDPAVSDVQEAHRKLAAVIAEKVGGTPGDALTLIERAKSEAWAMVQEDGCEDADVVALRELFDADLAPALQ